MMLMIFIVFLILCRKMELLSLTVQNFSLDSDIIDVLAWACIQENIKYKFKNKKLNLNLNMDE